MKVNFNKPLINFDDTPMKQNKVVEIGSTGRFDVLELNENLMLNSIIVNALSTRYKEDDNLEQRVALERFELALRIKKAKGEIEITTEDAVLIKNVALKGCTILAHGRICELIEDVK